MGHISVMRWALEVEKGGFLSQLLMGGFRVVISRPRSHVLGVKPPEAVSASRCLIHWLPHPDFRGKSCDKGLEAVTKQPRGASMMAMNYQVQVRNQHPPYTCQHQ
jgi:hypothetical protein